MEELLGPDPLTEAPRAKIREMILTLTEAELCEVLAALPFERSKKRRGYRNGKKQRWITTGFGATLVELPRAWMLEDGQDK